LDDYRPDDFPTPDDDWNAAGETPDESVDADATYPPYDSYDDSTLTPPSVSRAITPRRAQPPVPPEDSDSAARSKGRARARYEARKRRNPNLSREVNDSLERDSSPTRERRERVRTPRHTAPPPSSSDWIPQSARNRARQVQPAGSGFKLPTRNLQRWLPILYASGGVVLIVAIIIALNLFKNEEEVIPPDAIWLGTEWTYAASDPEQIRALVGRLKDHNISTVYAWVSWLKEDGTWAGRRSSTNQFIEMESTVRDFVTTFRQAYPDATLYGWLGFPVELGADGYRLDEVDVQERVADFSLKIVEDLGFDGVFLNVEQVWNENADDFVNLLIKVRSRMGEAGLIAAAIPPDWSPAEASIPKPPLIRPGTEWDKRFKQRVALLTDQMAIMAYNSGLSDPNDYVQWVAYQVQTYAQAVHELDAGAQIIIGIPTYEDELPGHDTRVENVPSALTGVKVGLQASGEAAVRVYGVAMYAEWTTDSTEWQQYFEEWARTRG